MTYFNGHGFTDCRGQWRYAPTTAIYCDTCAESAIPLPQIDSRRDGESDAEHARRAGGQRHHGTDFKWAPWYGGNTACMKCGKLV